MINRQSLLSDLQKLLQKLEADLLERSMSAEVPEVGVRLKEEHKRATKAQRTAQNYEDWRTDAITQAAAAWVLSCVFVRFLEDNRLIDPPRISGPSLVTGHSSLANDKGQMTNDSRLQRARDEHELYFRKHPKQTDREYLLSIFDQLAKLPGTKDVFGEHNPIRELPNWLSGDAAGELLKFFQKIDANTGALVHDFTDANWDTRFLGDLYQDLSEAARKKYALLQTPEFVEEFILDRTLEPALDEFTLTPSPPSGGEGRGEGADLYFKMIDPACGSGHFLLGSFPRILDRWMKKEPGTNVRELVQRTLHSIHGVDVNPFAIAIARFRLLLAALKACGIQRLADAPAFEMNLVCGDSLLHAPLASGGSKYTAGQRELDFALAVDPDDSDECDHAYRSENLSELKRVLRSGQYHTVVANPPYITPKDKQLNDRYRKRFQSCHMKYSLSVPFLERIFQLALKGGYTGQITANSFMKREFGKKLIESFFPSVDLTHVIDTSGAYIPGHGTPTVILFGRYRSPVASTLRTVMGIRGEPSTPADPARGLVWSAIIEQLDQPGSQSDFVSVGDSPRDLFHKHPWSIGGGGASELKELLDESAPHLLEDCIDVVGIFGMTNADEAMFAPKTSFRRHLIEAEAIRPLLTGDQIRDWDTVNGDWSLFPYENGGLIDISRMPKVRRRLWSVRTVLGNRATFARLTYFLEGRPWWEWHQVALDRIKTRLTIAFPCVATHNHFVLERGKYVFNRHSPIIKLPAVASEDDHHGLLGLLNSPITCFWLKQVGHNKGDSTDQHGARTTGDPAFNTYEYGAAIVAKIPLPAGRPLLTARLLDILATRARDFQPASIASRAAPTRAALDTAKSAAQLARSQMIAAQEGLDWECYRLYGLITEDLTLPDSPPLELGERAFEIVLARKMAAGETQTTWFERHGSTPITELPSEWPDDYRQLVERRIALIESDPNIRLIEQPEYKRRWNTESWESQLERALREWLLNRLEGYFDFDGRMSFVTGHSSLANDKGQMTNDAAAKGPAPLAEIQLVSVARLASVAGQDADFLQVGELYRDDAAFDVQALVTELVAPECVPLLPVLRYKPTGRRKRVEWEKTWVLQREEDRLEALRVAADERIEKAREAVSESFGESKRELDSLAKELLEMCLMVRDKFAPKVDFTGIESASVMARLLGSRGVAVEGGAALVALTSMQKSFESASARFSERVNAVLKDDPEYLVSVAARKAIPANPKIDVPPKYDSKDFLTSDFWRLRGKLDVAKERWISFPHCDGPDGTMMLCWAGYDHLQQARAISAYYVQVQTEFGGSDDPRLIPLLACLIELLPWLKQWHNDLDPDFNMPMGDYFEGFINEEARRLGKTLQEIREWTPPAKTRTKRGK